MSIPYTVRLPEELRNIPRSAINHMMRIKFIPKIIDEFLQSETDIKLAHAELRLMKMHSITRREAFALGYVSAQTRRQTAQAYTEWRNLLGEKDKELGAWADIVPLNIAYNHREKNHENEHENK